MTYFAILYEQTTFTGGSMFLTLEDAEHYRSSKTRTDGRIVEVDYGSEIVFCKKSGISGFCILADGRLIRDYVVETHQAIDRETNQPYHFLSTRIVEINTIGMTPAGASLIGLVLGSDSEYPNWLGKVRDVHVLRTHGGKVKAGGFAGPEFRQLVITLDGGVNLEKTELTEGYSEGYACEFFDSEASALRSIGRRDWFATERLECGATYKEPGFVEPGAMGCDRCNSTQGTGWQGYLN